SQQYREFISGWQSEVPKLSLDAIRCHDERGHPQNTVLLSRRQFVDFKMKLVGERDDFLEKSPCVLASRAVLPRNDQGRVTLREKQQTYVAGEFLEDVFDFSLIVRRQKSHAPIIDPSFLRNPTTLLGRTSSIAV